MGRWTRPLAAALVLCVAPVARAGGGPGDGCSAFKPCGDPLSCKPFVMKCFPEGLRDTSEQYCAAMKIDKLVEAARNTGNVMSYGVGSSAGGGAAASDEIGTVYGPNGEFGCYVTGCVGWVTNASLADSYTQGFYDEWDSFAGSSSLLFEGVSTPIIKAGGYTAGQVFGTDGSVIGSTMAISFGVGLSPIEIGHMQCHTTVVDGNVGLEQLERALAEATEEARAAKAKQALEDMVLASVSANMPVTEVGVDGTSLVRADFAGGSLVSVDGVGWVLRDAEGEVDSLLVEDQRDAQRVRLLSVGALMLRSLGVSVTRPEASGLKYEIDVASRTVRSGTQGFGALSNASPLDRAWRTVTSIQDPCDAPDAGCDPQAPRTAFLDMGVNVDVIGDEYRRFDMEVADPATCLRQCSIEDECLAYTYVPPANLGAAVCHLKSSATRTVLPRAGSVSGRKVVTLFSDCDYQGHPYAWEGGTAYTKQLNQMGFAGDDISSVRVPDGLVVTLFDEDKAKGASQVLTEDVACLADVGFDDRTSSLKVARVQVEDEAGAEPPPPPPFRLQDLTTQGVDSWNVVYVDVGTGHFEKNNESRWSEAGVSDRFYESERDETSVYLWDVFRGVALRIDLQRGVVGSGHKGEPGADLYPIQSAYRQDFGPYVDDGVTGDNVVRVEAGDHTFYQIDDETWTEEGVSASYFVHRRSVTGVLLRDLRRETSVFLDVADRRVLQGKVAARFVDRIGMLPEIATVDAAYRKGKTQAERDRERHEAELVDRRAVVKESCRTGWASTNQCVEYGDMLYQGLGGPQSYEGALEAYEHGCHQRFITDACLRAAEMVDRGLPEGVDYQRSVDAYTRACHRDHGASCSRLGEILTSGEDVPVDEFGARYAFRAACDLGFATDCDSFLFAFREGWGNDDADVVLASGDRAELRDLRDRYRAERDTLDTLCAGSAVACTLAQDAPWPALIERRFAEDLFNGVHVGVEGGASFRTVDSGSVTGLDARGIRGGLRGLIGYDHMIGKGLVGAEVAAGAALGAPLTASASGASLESRSGAAFTASVRVGYVVGEHVLVYARGGYAGNWMRAEAVVADAAPVVVDQLQHGFLVGGGAEVALGRDVALRAELRFEDFAPIDGLLDDHRSLQALGGVRFTF